MTMTERVDMGAPDYALMMSETVSPYSTAKRLLEEMLGAEEIFPTDIDLVATLMEKADILIYLHENKEASDGEG